MKKPSGVSARIIKASEPIRKAELSTEIQTTARDDGAGFILPPADLRGYKRLVNHSSILPQCIRAYKNNIAGFGIGVRYKEDVEETSEMKAEWDKITEVLEFLNIDQDTKEVFEDIIEARETYGIAYLEVIRNLAGEVIGVEFINNIPSVQKSVPLTPYVDIEYEINGRTETRRKKFRKYRQQVNGKTVFFKEIGDPRIMDLRTGSYGENVPVEYQANELLEFAIGTEPYGEVRWLGTVLNVDGSKKAEGLNNRYFSEGRHTPLMLMINGGTLTDESFEKLQHYMDDIKGENGQHAFIVLEAENLENRTDMEGEEKPNIEVVKMADILQKDELFQDYLDNNRRKVQSAFQLPDLYVGYTTDFNRATAQSAQEVTEKQVFQPERQSLAWVINNKLLADYHFKYVEAYFLEPDISNPDDLFKLLTVCSNAGGLTPNKAKEIIYKTLGETSENFEGDWADLPLSVAQTQGTAGFDSQLSQQIQKSVEHRDDEITVVLKEIRKLLINDEDLSQKPFTFIGKNDIIRKWDEEQHPRDEKGRFTNVGGPTAPLVDGPTESAAYIESYFSEHSEVEEEAKKYLSVLSNVQNFAADHPGAEEGTYDAVTGEKLDPKNLNGYCVTFHQNLSMSDPYGAYTAESYAALCAIAKNELGAQSVNIGFFGGTAEVSFVCESQKAAVDFAIAHNQHSIYDPTEGEWGEAIENAYFNPDTNAIEGH